LCRPSFGLPEAQQASRAQIEGGPHFQEDQSSWKNSGWEELSELAQEYGIRAMPTFLIFKDGEKVDEIVGANPVKLEEKIKLYVK
jgi:thiol-disulfide isomerase/thioredoxin